MNDDSNVKRPSETIQTCHRCGDWESATHYRTCSWFAKCQIRIDSKRCPRDASNVIGMTENDSAHGMGACMQCLEELQRRSERDSFGWSQPRSMWLTAEDAYRSNLNNPNKVQHDGS